MRDRDGQGQLLTACARTWEAPHAFMFGTHMETPTCMHCSVICALDPTGEATPARYLTSHSRADSSSRSPTVARNASTRPPPRLYLRLPLYWTLRRTPRGFCVRCWAWLTWVAGLEAAPLGPGQIRSKRGAERRATSRRRTCIGPPSGSVLSWHLASLPHPFQQTRCNSCHTSSDAQRLAPAQFAKNDGHRFMGASWAVWAGSVAGLTAEGAAAGADCAAHADVVLCSVAAGGAVVVGSCAGDADSAAHVRLAAPAAAVEEARAVARPADAAGDATAPVGGVVVGGPVRDAGDDS